MGKFLPCLLVVVSFLACTAYATAPPTTKNVLVLFSFTKRDDFDSLKPLKATMRSRLTEPVNFDVEYLESQRFRIPGYEEGLSETLHKSYGEEKIDLVVVAAYPALRFARDHHDQIFPGVPIVFMSVAADRIEDKKVWPGITGVTTPVDVSGTIELALALHPSAQTVAVIAGSSEFEQYWLAATRKALRPHENSLKIVEFTGLPTDQVLQRVSALPPDTVVFFELVPVESAQPVLGTFEVLQFIAQRFPTYCVHNYCIDYGAIGGSYPDADEQGIKAGEIAARVLSGETADQIPIMHGSVDHAEVNWQQLQHWNVPESKLPPGTIFWYRQPTLWERDHKYILPAVGLVVFQALLITGLLWQRARKRKTEAVLRESEKRFRVMADTTPSLVWMCDKEGKITYLNDRRVAFTGPDPSAGYGDTWTSYVHPEDVKNVLDIISKSLKDREPFSKEYRLRRRDGVYRWMFDVASPRVNGDGTFAGFIGSAIDVTDQKLAQEALEKVSGRLIEAQEKERSRIARDLHDDICQRLALLSMELEQANRSSNGSSPAVQAKLREVQQHCSEIAGDVQALSHQLHSSKLDYLGIAAAIRGFCKEFAKQHDLSIEFTEENVPKHMSKQNSLCLFRVAQEALHNAVKYSGARQFTVDVTGTADEVQLVVTDRGVGFDLEGAKRTPGLGLVSMQERVHVAHGRFKIQSKPGEGTRVTAAVPLVSENGSSPDDWQDYKTASMTGGG
jgi:PAS domain S-box-containing protein